MKIYVSGPMTGLPDFNYPAFFKAAAQLADAGHEPINPARVRADLPKTPTTWQEFMQCALRDLADADAVAVLPGWRASRGSRLEVHIAEELDLPVETIEDWLTDGDS